MTRGKGGPIAGTPIIRDRRARAGSENTPVLRARRPRVSRLRAQHVRERRATFHRDRHAVNEPDDSGQRGPGRERFECGDQRRSGTTFRERLPQLHRQLAVRDPRYPLQRAHRTLTGTDRKGEHLGDGRELRNHPRFAPPYRTAEQVVANHDAEDREDTGEHE